MALYIDYGIVSTQRLLDEDRSWPDLYADVLAIAEVVEEEGFDGFWVTEHHFTDDGYLSALFPMLAALAARTERIHLGTNVALAPFYHPLRLAEDAAFVDNLSGGRLSLGLAIGYRDPEFDAFGVPKSERVPRLVECVEVCRKAWSGEPFSHHGPVIDVEDLIVRPPAVGPPAIWLGGWADASIERAARLADAYTCPVGDAAETRRRTDLLDKAAAEVGRTDGLLPVSNLTTVHVSADGSIPEPVMTGIEHMLARYADWYGSSSDEAGGREVGRQVQALREAGQGALLATVVTGTAEEVVERLAPLAREFAGERDHRICVRLDYPGMGLSEVGEQVRIFGREVIPALREMAA